MRFYYTRGRIGKYRYTYEERDTYAFILLDKYILASYTQYLVARKEVAFEDIEMEGLSETEENVVKLDVVRAVLFQSLLFNDGRMYAELKTIYLLNEFKCGG